MIDDSMSNVLNKYLEDIIVRQDNQILGLLSDLEDIVEKRDNEIRVLRTTIADKDKQMEEKLNWEEQLLTRIQSQETEIKAFEAVYRSHNNLIDSLGDQVAYLEQEVVDLKDQRLEDEVDDLEHAVLMLRGQQTLDQETIDRMNLLLKMQEDEIMAISIQAAEAEDRAEEEKRKRLALMMRI